MNFRKSNPIMLLSLLMLAMGCTPQRMYVISVIERSEPREPYWITRHSPGTFIGIGEAPTMEAANRAALNNLMSKISNEIGVEVSASGEIVRKEADGEVSETASYQVDAFSGAMLRDIMRRVSNSYWEHCRAQTGKKNFEDFYRYFVAAEVPGALIDTLRVQTRLENDLKLARFREGLDRAAGILAKDVVRPMDALSELTVAMQGAAGLYYNRTGSIEEAGDRILGTIRDLHLSVEQGYSEVRPERHYIDYRVTYGGRPAAGVKLRFGLTNGWGGIKESAVTDAEGEARCEVFSMQSQQAENQITASFDLSEVEQRIGAIKHPSAAALKETIELATAGQRRVERFSTLSKKARVTAGSLFVTDVAGTRVNVFYRRVRKLDMSFSMTEHNGRDVVFDQYAVRVECWYVDDPIFATKSYSDSRTGTFPLPNNIQVSHYATRDVTIPYNEPISSLINDLKSSHEIGMRSITLEVRLLGKDDAGNVIEVELSSEPMTWDRLFER